MSWFEEKCTVRDADRLLQIIDKLVGIAKSHKERILALEERIARMDAERGLEEAMAELRKAASFQ